MVHGETGRETEKEPGKSEQTESLGALQLSSTGERRTPREGTGRVFSVPEDRWDQMAAPPTWEAEERAIRPADAAHGSPVWACLGRDGT